jgi:hypothetical protein
MVNRKRGKPLVLFFFSLIPGFFSGGLLAAQEPTLADEGNSFLVGSQVVQRLSWNSSELALRYEVALEEIKDGKKTEVLRQSTQENFLVLSLRPGSYRYQVGVYNFFNRLEYTMDWVEFEILTAVPPTLDSFTPKEFFLDIEKRWQITVTGENIDPEAEFGLRPQIGEGSSIAPQSKEFKENTIRLVFNSDLPAGLYVVYVRNPGGLEASLRTFTVHPLTEEGARARRPDVTVSLGYAPVLSLYGVLFVDSAFENPFAPLGFSLRAGFIPFKWGWIRSLRHYLGVDLEGSWYMLREEKELYTASAQVLGARLRVLYQLWLPNLPLAFNFRFGGGITAILDFHYDYGNGGDDHFSSGYATLDGGLSFQWHVIRGFFIEAGADFTHVFSTGDKAQPGYIRPTLNAGWRF